MDQGVKRKTSERKKKKEKQQQQSCAKMLVFWRFLHILLFLLYMLLRVDEIFSEF